jgi:hypothetical protein
VFNHNAFGAQGGACRLPPATGARLRSDSGRRNLSVSSVHSSPVFREMARRRRRRMRRQVLGLVLEGGLILGAAGTLAWALGLS